MASITEIEKGKGEKGRLIRAYYKDADGGIHTKGVRWYPEQKMNKRQMDKAAADIGEQMERDLRAEYNMKPAMVSDNRSQNGVTLSADYSNLTLPQYYRGRFIQRRKLKKNIRETTEEYYQNLGVSICDYFDGKLLSEITPQDIEQYLEYLSTQYVKRDGKPLSRNTVYKYYRVLKTLYSTAVKDHVCAYNPLSEVEPPATERIPVIAMDQSEEETFVNALSSEPLKFQAYALIAIHGGLRLGEIIGLQWQDIDCESQCVYVSKNVTVTKGSISIGVPKTDAGIRTAYLSDIAVDALQRLYAERKPQPDDFLFHAKGDTKKPQYPSNMTRAVKRYCKRIKMEQYTSHQLRHTCGTLLNACGVDIKSIQAQLGHSNSEITNRFYIKDLPEHRKSMVQQTFNRKDGGAKS